MSGRKEIKRSEWKKIFSTDSVKNEEKMMMFSFFFYSYSGKNRADHMRGIYILHISITTQFGVPIQNTMQCHSLCLSAGCYRVEVNCIVKYNHFLISEEKRLSITSARIM